MCWQERVEDCSTKVGCSVERPGPARPAAPKFGEAYTSGVISLACARRRIVLTEVAR